MLHINELEAMGRQLRYLRARSDAQAEPELASDISRHNRLVDDARMQLERARASIESGGTIAEGTEMELRFCIAFLARQAAHLLGRHGRTLAEAQIA
ncbi:hypothetical protein [Anaeromyxobacter paludicola]|uniref:Uncharacterized protein n=1 Tax=Anaeromyxobacter paludicola TaxID=2918171 RepID=A0ABM7X678_9BACT|nr:hypothetical protein [Anaeromyxobacter paludicola]BDG07320.1 hypothetical protein AMPC_04330 [Anaeromyxobacter paludicola]